MSNIDTELAFDYDLQEWVEGARAVELKICQKQQTIDLINGENGAAYCNSVGLRNPKKALADLTSELIRLRRLMES